MSLTDRKLQPRLKVLISNLRSNYLAVEERHKKRKYIWMAKEETRKAKKRFKKEGRAIMRGYRSYARTFELRDRFKK